MFEGMVAQGEDKPREVPTEHQDAARWWLRGWDTQDSDLKREAPSRKTTMKAVITTEERRLQA